MIVDGIALAFRSRILRMILNATLILILTLAHFLTLGHLLIIQVI